MRPFPLRLDPLPDVLPVETEERHVPMHGSRDGLHEAV